MSDQRAWNIDARDAMVQLMHRSPQNRKSVLAAVIPISYERIGNEPDRYPAGHTQVFAIEQSVRPQPFSGHNKRPQLRHGDKSHHDTGADPQPTTINGKFPRRPQLLRAQHENHREDHDDHHNSLRSEEHTSELQS